MITIKIIIGINNKSKQLVKIIFYYPYI